MKPKFVIIVIIDALRADHLGCYDYSLPTSPHLDEFSKDAMLYKYAFAPCSYTIPSVTGMFTSTSAGNNSLLFQQKSGTLNHDRDITLAEILKSEGYKTAAFVGSYVLRKDWGLNAGFDVYDDQMTDAELNRPSELIRDGKETNEAVFKWLNKEGSSPFFLFIHYFDVHGPYVNPEPYNSIFKVDDYMKKPLLLERVPNWRRGGIPEYQLLNVIRNEAGEIIDYERDARYYFAQYDGSIRYCDGFIGDFLNILKEKDIYDEALIMVTADHGEAMGENDVYFFHGLTVTYDQIRVPLFIKYPQRNGTAGIFEKPVSTLDITPTAVAMTNRNYSDFDFEGIDLLTIDKKGNFDNRFIISENPWQRAIIKENHIFINRKSNIFSHHNKYYDASDLCSENKLYNYVNDPHCKNNLIGKVSDLKDFKKIEKFFSLHVNPKEQTINDKDQEIEMIQHQLQEKEQQIQSIYSSIYSSRTWKLGRIVTAPWRFAKEIFFKKE